MALKSTIPASPIVHASNFNACGMARPGRGGEYNQRNYRSQMFHRIHSSNDVLIAFCVMEPAGPVSHADPTALSQTETMFV